MHYQMISRFGEGDKDEERGKSGFIEFEQSVTTGISAYAGGRNTSQSAIAEGVRQRFIRILSDII